MKEAVIVYPHQLFEINPAFKKGRVIYLVEEPLFINEFPTHKQKVLFHRLSLRAYYKSLQQEGWDVTYIDLTHQTTSESVFERVYIDGIQSVHVIDVTDNWLSQRIIKGCEKYNISITWYESPLFILQKEEAIQYYGQSGKRLVHFYKRIRKDKKILVDHNGQPYGGKWSFDNENRKPLKSDVEMPPDIVLLHNEDISDARIWASHISGEQYGEEGVWLPYTREGAQKWFEQFLAIRFVNFGTYEDAISSSSTLLFHSALSPLLNCGLLNPTYVLNQTFLFAENNAIPFNSVEGFIRQLIGWREFIRSSYEVDGSRMRTMNFWNHSQPLPQSFWTGTTNLHPVDMSIQRALKYGYTHHIERLMVIGNSMLLLRIHPHEVYKWFMAMYVDAYDWVMVPNVYGMSQFSDGGIFATKPYIAGGNYIKKMSNYASGEWEDVITSLYWRFIQDNYSYFQSQYRLSMMTKLLDVMDQEKKNRIKIISDLWLSR